MTDIATLQTALDAIPAAKGRAGPPRFTDGRASLILDVTGLDLAAREALDGAIKGALGALPGVESVRIAQTSEKGGRRLIAVASGKGGVGKSTLSANLAIALSRQGLKVGLIDADIYGPSQPRLMATEGAKPMASGNRLEPVPTRFGIPMLSIGHLVEPGQAVAWRGPMAGNALGQIIDADWGAADVLIVDLPPGTGDVQLSMISKHKPAGAVIVSTPQDLALIDATRAIDLFNQSGVPVIGMVENMSGYECPHCGEVSDPFGSGGAKAAAGTMDLPFLGRIPLDIAIRTASDAGDPPAAGNSAQGQAFADIAAKVADWLKDH
ncbi:Mrp/NBP35 family ATP-binding protein [Sphingomonas sp. SUN039]|uniref:Mrp/NBP35 family ATP-binding protein n=1 Tax=Sphingomonas sp. SUN039 TaxID=2937787 RepID=UPI002164BE9B|nr:Mrp/NBP35 family ATP-binding protein [Sphingomonas sp. SUN039]UVO54687.1 Mrp/NBP35 family ATP-binding protein [Sphingomonas sp. SUN039]